MQIRSDNICILGHPNPSCRHALLHRFQPTIELNINLDWSFEEVVYGTIAADSCLSCQLDLATVNLEQLILWKYSSAVR